MRAGSRQQINGKEQSQSYLGSGLPDAHRETGQTGELTRTHMISD
jgi:hypothetical protein